MLPSRKEEEKDEDEYISQGTVSPDGSIVVVRGPSLAGIVEREDHAAYYNKLLDSAMATKPMAPIVLDDNRNRCNCGQDHNEQRMRDLLDEFLTSLPVREIDQRPPWEPEIIPLQVPFEDVDETQSTDGDGAAFEDFEVPLFEPITIITEGYPDVRIQLPPLGSFNLARVVRRHEPIAETQ